MTWTKREIGDLVTDYLKQNFDLLGFPSDKFTWFQRLKNGRHWIHVKRDHLKVFSVRLEEDGKLMISGGVSANLHDPDAKILREAIEAHLNYIFLWNRSLDPRPDPNYPSGIDPRFPEWGQT